MLFQTSSVIESVATRVDGTIKIVVSTQELQPEQAVALFSLKGKQGWLLFKENAITESEIPSKMAEEFINKESPMAALARALHVYWDKSTSKSMPFDEFLRSWATKKKAEILEHVPK